MAYEKKKFKKQPKSKQRKSDDAVDSISMAPKSSKDIKRESVKDKPLKRRAMAPRQPLEIIEGGETKRRRARLANLITVGVSLLVVILLVAAQLLTPTGLIEWTRNRVAAMGIGQLPTEVSGSKALNMQRSGGRVNILTDTELIVYGKSGKLITTVQHGYSSPVMRTSAERTLVYDCGGRSVRVDTLTGNIFTVSDSDTVICADISDSGSFAVVTSPDDYAATMTVYDKGADPVYRWNSSGRIISSVCLSPNGKYAVAFTVTSVSGKYQTVANIFDSEGAGVATVQIDEHCVLSSYANNGTVFAIGSDFVASFDWDGGGLSVYDYPAISFIDAQSNLGLLVAVGAANSSSTVYVVDASGKQSEQLELDSSISDAVLVNSGVYILTGNTVEYVPFEGERETLGDIGYEYRFLSPFGRSVMALSDMKLQKLKR